MSRFPLSLLAVFTLACGSTTADHAGPEDPCGLAMSMRSDALRELSSAPACEADDDCVVVSTAIKCANVQIGECGTLVNRATQSGLDWARTEREICQAVEGSAFGCSVSALCTALEAPRCEGGVCTQPPSAN
jgi:hypothetical protein